MRNRIVTAVKQRFSIRKLSIGAASVLLGTSLYFMGGSATIVHAGTNVSGTETSKAAPASAGVRQKAPTNDKIARNELDSIAGNNHNNDTAVNDAIDKYAQVKQKEVGDNALIRPSDKEPTTIANTAKDRVDKVNSIADKLDQDVTDANQEAEEIKSYISAHPNTVSGEGAEYFADQGLSVDDEKDSVIKQITVDQNKITFPKDQSKNISKNIDGIDITRTNIMTPKETKTMKVNSNNKVIVDFHNNQCLGKEITVTYNNLNNSYYLENINKETNRIKISRIDRTFSIQEVDNPTLFTPNGKDVYKNDDIYDKCDGPQLIIYNDPSDGFFYNNITQISVKDIFYDDNGSQIKFDKNDKNKAWIFVTSLNSNGGGNWGNIEKVRAQDQDPNNSSANGVKIAGSTVTNQNGWWYSIKNNWFNKNPDWDNRDEANRFGFVGTVAFQYHPGMTLQYRADDSYWGSHWACMQTQVVSSLNTPVIIYDHIKDGIVTVDTKHPQTPNTPIDPDDPQSPKYPKDINDTEHVVNRTIDYKYSNGKQAQDTVDDHLTFERTVVIDKVTGDVLSDTWTPSQDFNDVKTPVIQGYTPDKTVVSDKSIGHDHQDIIEHVVYNADKQTAHVIYIDKTTGNTLETTDLIGVSDQDSEYNTKDTIGKYESKHYVLTGDETNGKNVIFDHDDKADQTYYVYFVHGTQNVSRQDDVTETVDYKFENGETAQPTVTQTKHFSEDGVKDLVTNGITWTPAKPQKFDDVTTPVISGYTPDNDKVAGSTVNFGDNDIVETATYHNNAQTAKISYIDDVTKNTLASDSQNGKFDHEITFEHDPAEVINGLKEKGYKLVSNDFKDGTKYKADDKQNEFIVHLTHDKPSKEGSKTPEKPDKPGKGDETKPGKGDETKPGKGDETKPGKGDETKPGKGDETKPGKGDETKPGKEGFKTPEKPDQPSKEGSKTPEKPIDSRTVDNHVSAKSTAKRELPQTSATINTGIWTGLVSMIASLGLLGASKKRKKN